MADIFISYAKEDHNRLERLASALKVHGWSVFWDPVIPVGKTWREVIGAELENARCVIVAWSKKSNTSHWVLEESEIGRERGVLIPVLIDNVLPPLGFRSLQAANLTIWKGDTSDPNFQFLISNLATVLGQSSASGIPFTNRPPVSRKKLFAIGGGVALALIIAVLIYSLFLRSWLISPMNSRDPATDTVTTQEAARIAEEQAREHERIAAARVPATVTDVDGNTYRVVQIGNQVWMAENLRTARYNDGTAIPLVTNNSSWSNLSTPAYCWHENDKNQYAVPYGALYNWYTVNTGKLCPTGWHVPSDAEWTTLTTFLGGTSVAGGKMKQTGTARWRSPNTGATNSSGFSGVPGGGRLNYVGTFYNMGYYGGWWSSTAYSDLNAWGRRLDYDGAYVHRYYYSKSYGFSVRCLRD